MTNPHEPMDPPRQLVGHRARVAGLLVAVVVAIGVGTWLAPASADDPADAAAIDAVFFEDPGDDGPGRDDFREDLKDLRDLEGDERRDAMKQLHEDARDGKYGDRLEMRTDRRADHRAAFFALLPDELQDDLKEVREADPEDRKAMHENIREKARSGDYGEKVKEAFTILEKSRRD